MGRTLIAPNRAAKVMDMRGAVHWLLVICLLSSGWLHAAHDHTAHDHAVPDHAVAQVEGSTLLASLSGGAGPSDSHSSHDEHSAEQTGCDATCAICAAFGASCPFSDLRLWVITMTRTATSEWSPSTPPSDPLLLRRDRPPCTSV